PPPPPQFTNVTIITFDRVPDGTDVSQHYSQKGVTFASITTQPANTWGAFARANPIAETRPNVIAINKSGIPAFDSSMGGIEATFKAPQRYVSIDVWPFIVAELPVPVTSRPFLELYDDKGNILQTVYLTIPPTDYYSWHTLAWESSRADIAKVRFSSEFVSSPHLFGLFDQLIFSEHHPFFRPIQIGPA